MRRRRNPYIKCLKQSVTIRLDKNTVAYSKELSAKIGILPCLKGIADTLEE